MDPRWDDLLLTEATSSEKLPSRLVEDRDRDGASSTRREMLWLREALRSDLSAGMRREGESRRRERASDLPVRSDELLREGA